VGTPRHTATPHERKFLFSAGVGLDASVVEQVEAHPRLKARFGEWYYTTTALRTFSRRYLFHPPRLEADLGGGDESAASAAGDESAASAAGPEQVTGVTVIVQNGAPYTYFGNVPVHMGEGAALDSGDLAGVVLERASPIDIPTIIWRALSKHVHFNRHRQVHAFTGVTSLRVHSLDSRPLPMQADGDYIGEASEAEFGVTPAGLLVVA
jgi:diacylglycerol kinase family enzyme